MGKQIHQQDYGFARVVVQSQNPITEGLTKHMATDVTFYRNTIFFEYPLKVHISPGLVNRLCAVAVQEYELVGAGDIHFTFHPADNFL